MAITTNKSVTLKASATGGTFTLNAKLTENSVNVSNNISNITVVATLSKGTGAFQGTGGTLYIDWYDNNTNTITQKGSKGISTLTSGSINVSATFDVTHLSNGTLSGYARARWVRGSSTYAPSSGNVSTNTTALTNIPRNTTISLLEEKYGTGYDYDCIYRTNFSTYIGSSDYTTKLEYSWNNHSGTLTENLTKNLALSFNGAITDSNYQCITFPYTFKQIATELPSAKNTNIQLILKTYSGGTQIGDTFTYTYNYKIGEIYPTATISLETTDTLSNTLSGNKTTFINGVSNVKMTFSNVNFSGTGTVKNYQFVGNGEIITQTGSSYTFKNKVDLSNPKFYSYLTSNRDITYTMDEKSYSNYTTKDYTKPTISSFTTKRADTTSTTINVNVSGTYWNKSFGSVTNSIQSISIKMTPSTGSATTKTITPTLNGANYSGSTTFTLATTSDATFVITLTDKVSTITQQGSVSKSIAAFDIGDDYMGINYDLYIANESNVLKKMIDLIYPIGTIYTSVNNVSPQTFFGGTWVQIKDTFLLTAGDKYGAGTTGGEATHTLTQSEIPNYLIGNIPDVVASNHANWDNDGVNGVSIGAMSSSKPGVANNGNVKTSGTQYGWAVYTNGGDTAHNNMPPYLVVYAWKRTA